MRLFLIALVALTTPALISADEIAEKAELATKAEQAKRAVESSARYYRIQVYEQFRKERAVYDRFRQQGDSVLTAWKETSKSFDGDKIAISWFENAKDLTTQGATNPPEIPQPLEEAWARFREAKKAKLAVPALPRKSVEDIPVKRTIEQSVPPQIMTPAITDLPVDAASEPKTAQPKAFGFQGVETDSLSPPSPPAKAPAKQPADTDAGETHSGSVFKSLGRAILKGATN